VPQGKISSPYEPSLALGAEVSSRRRHSAEKRESVGDIGLLFADRGIIYRSHNSVTAKGRWGEEYVVEWDGRKVTLD
jgi:hypothetical protein